MAHSDGKILTVALIVEALAARLECHRRPAASGYALLGIEPTPLQALLAAE
jgi:hypothetical protein